MRAPRLAPVRGGNGATMYLGCSSQSYEDEIGTGRLSLPEWFRLCAEELGLTAVELEDKHIGDPAPGAPVGPAFAGPFAQEEL